MQPRTWLACDVSAGQFTGEYVVTAQDFRSSTFSLFVPEVYVECDDEPIEGRAVNGRLQVEVLDKNETLALVRLPRYTLENGPTVTVSLKKLVTKPAREPA